MTDNNHKASILIVDDEKGLRIGTQRLLQMEGYFVEAAENGTEGIKLGTSKEYDIAIIDLKMPDIDGISVLKEIKSNYPNTICYIATAYASYDSAIEATKIGAYGYIPKPFTPEELMQHIEKGIERRQLIIEAEKLRKEREARLLEVAFEKTRLNTIINSLKDGVLVVNKTGELVLFNPAVMKYFEFEVLTVGEMILERLPEKISTTINSFLEDSTFVERSYSVQIEMKPLGELIIDATASPVPHPDGTLAGVVVIIRDITEMKKVEFVKSQFISMVAHELKAPIAAVIGFIKLIMDDSIQVSYEQQQSYLSRSYVRLQGLLTMVNDLLDISRMDVKHKVRELVDVNILEVIKTLIEFFEFELKKKNITLELNHPDEIPLIKFDINEVNKLFTNLISNAIKYNRDSGIVKIDVSIHGNYIVTRISDTGIGMKEEEKKKLFQEFYRAKNEQTRNIGGTGLGLSIVKRIVDSYAGKVEVESEYNVGTAFTVSLLF